MAINQIKQIKLPNGTAYDITLTDESKKLVLNNAALTGIPTAPTANAGTDSTQIATTAFVIKEIGDKLAAADAMIFKGTINSENDLPAIHNAGWTYKIATAGNYAGFKCEIGDMIICLVDGTTANNSHWTVVQNNIDGAVTGPISSVNNRIAVFNGTSGKVIKDSGYTIGTSVPENAVFTDTGATAVEITGDGNAITTVSYDETNRTITLSKNETFALKEEAITEAMLEDIELISVDDIDTICGTIIQNTIINEVTF